MTKEIKCPHCGANFEILEDVSFTSCPYCGYTFNVQTMQEWEHFFFPVYVTHDLAWTKLRSFILRRYGVPHDFNEEANLTNVALHYVPLHVFHAEAEAECKSSKGTAVYHKVFDLIIPAFNGLWFDSILRNHKFSVRGRIFFKPSILKRGKYYPPTLGSQEAKSIVQNIASSSVLNEARESCKGNYNLSKVEINYVGLVHYPIWELHYNYKNESYKSLIDSTNSRVMYVEYPLSREARIFLLSASAFLVFSCSLGGLIVGSILFSSLSIFGILLGFVGSLFASFPLLSTALSLKERSSEEISREEKSSLKINVLELIEKFYGTRRVPVGFDL